MLSELPSPVTGGTILTVEDFQQELSCNINIKHRFVLMLYPVFGIALMLVFMRSNSTHFFGIVNLEYLLC